MFIRFKVSKIVDLILENVGLFDFFTKVYLFGSSIDENRKPNDIDLLLVYGVYSKELLEEKNSIILFLKEILTLPIDVTVLSEEELEETKFLEKLGTKFIKIK